MSKKRISEIATKLSVGRVNQHGQVGLAEVISNVDATVLIGLSTVKGIFTEPIVREMARRTERPISFPSSNPAGYGA